MLTKFVFYLQHIKLTFGLMYLISSSYHTGNNNINSLNLHKITFENIVSNPFFFWFCRNQEFSFQHFLKNQPTTRGQFDQPMEKASNPPDVATNYGYTSGYCYDYHSPYSYKQKIQNCWFFELILIDSHLFF